MAKNTISQLDLVMLGRRGITARVGSVESQVRRLALGGGGSSAPTEVQNVRPNLFTNSSFEFFDRNSTKPNDWTITGAAIVSVGSAGSDGTNTLFLPAGASISQAAAAGVVVPQSSVVISVAAKTAYAGQKIAISLTHTPGVQAGPIMRLDLTGGLLQTDDVPNDGQWYRFYRQFILTGGAQASGSIAQAGSGTLEIDAAKFEKEDGIASWLEPTAYLTADWGAATHIRNLAADNIVTGTLVVGGSISSNPRISVKDGSDVEIVTIGNPTGGFYGVEIKGAAGLRISGSGSAEVLGGGSVAVKGGGDITVNGGNIVVTNGQVQVNAATGGIVVSGGGSIAVNSGGSLSVSGSATVGGSLSVSGTFATSGNSTLGGNLTVSGTAVISGGLLRVGGATGKRLVLGASGLEAYDASDNRRVFLDADSGTLRIFGQNAVTMEGSGSLQAGLAWADAAGLWAVDNAGNAAFGVSGVDTHLWGGKTLDKGDVLLGNNSNYVLWDASASKLTVSGTINFGNGNGLLDNNGLGILADTTGAVGTNNSVTWYGSGWSGNIAQIYGQVLSGAAFMNVAVHKINSSGWLTLQTSGGGSGTYAKVQQLANTLFNVNAATMLEINYGDSVGKFTISNADVFAQNKLYVGNQTSRYFYDDGTYTRYNSNFVSEGDIYLGARAQWLSTYLNQAVLTTSSPTFADVTITGLGALKGSILNQAVKTTSTPSFAGLTSTARFTIDAALNASVVEVHNNDASGGLRTFLYSGEPGFSFLAGGVGYNWGPITGAASGRIDTAKGAVLYRMESTNGTGTMFSISSGGAVTTALIHNTTGIGFLGATPAARQTGGVKTAAATYGANEQSMLQTAYNALRTFGFLT